MSEVEGEPQAAGHPKLAVDVGGEVGHRGVPGVDRSGHANIVRASGMGRSSRYLLAFGARRPSRGRR